MQFCEGGENMTGNTQTTIGELVAAVVNVVADRYGDVIADNDTFEIAGQVLRLFRVAKQ